MAQRTDSFDLASLRMSPGEGRSLGLETAIDGFTLSERRYEVQPVPVRVKLDLSCMTGRGYALRLRFTASLVGPCMRCLEDAKPQFEVDSREVDQPGGGDELASPYVDGVGLELGRWAHDALGLTLPVGILCADDCAGLCADCGENLNREPGHRHEAPPDPRWAELDRLRFE